MLGGVYMAGFDEFDILLCMFLAAAEVNVITVTFSLEIDFVSHKYFIL
jgi:hypothetical protein